jgi:hypothetical protein
MKKEGRVQAVVGVALLTVFICLCRISRMGMGDGLQGDQIVAVHNGQVFHFNEVVHVFEGTAPGIRARKTEFFKAWFKGVDKSKEEERFICRPVVGHSGGPFPRFSKGAVFKVKVQTRTIISTLTLNLFLTLQSGGFWRWRVRGTREKESLGTSKACNPRKVMTFVFAFNLVIAYGFLFIVPLDAGLWKRHVNIFTAIS